MKARRPCYVHRARPTPFRDAPTIHTGTNQPVRDAYLLERRILRGGGKLLTYLWPTDIHGVLQPESRSDHTVQPLALFEISSLIGWTIQEEIEVESLWNIDFITVELQNIDECIDEVIRCPIAVFQVLQGVCNTLLQYIWSLDLLMMSQSLVVGRILDLAVVFNGLDLCSEQ